MDKKNTQGNIIFSRENLCRPITNEASIFPMEILMRSVIGMDKYTLVRNRDDFPIKFNSVWGVDDSGERWLLYMYREKGKKFYEQMQVLKGLNVRFRPDTMILEQNTFQQIFVVLLKKKNPNVSLFQLLLHPKYHR